MQRPFSRNSRPAPPARATARNVFVSQQHGNAKQKPTHQPDDRQCCARTRLRPGLHASLLSSNDALRSRRPMHRADDRPMLIRSSGRPEGGPMSCMELIQACRVQSLSKSASQSVEDSVFRSPVPHTFSDLRPHTFFILTPHCLPVTTVNQHHISLSNLHENRIRL